MNASADLDLVQREAATLLTVQTHSNVIGYVGMFWSREESPCFNLVLAAATGGDIFRRVKGEGVLPEAEARKLVAGAMRGLQHIHSKGVVHRDVKAENILISGDENEERALLADFGLATFLSDEAQMARRCGTPGFAAPEVCLGCRYGSNVDVFGMGVVLHYMLSTELPFQGRDDSATMRATVECRLRLRQPPWESLSCALRSILRSMIWKDPEERLSSAGALSHVWMRTHSSGRARNSGEEKPFGVAEQVEQQSMAQQRNEAVHSTVASSEVLPQGAAYLTPMVHPKLLCPRLSERTSECT
jgi:calcium/calmodulin-dependent protein kinase I